ncbi:hypothetical protein [Sutterella sp.]|uniref:hypothetical protein n=1 Tax=Sutterella sp. TaxID=1981025 RepID=UPI0026DF34B2|nr:hypothetical protein [Sutterella sp.]MDO5532588.1 hypothetical protein [Sutterella sp.]
MIKYRWHIKDADREAALIKALPGFMEILQHTADAEMSDDSDHINLERDLGRRDMRGDWHLCLDKAEVVDHGVPYDPNRWNKWPDVEPPMLELMRIRYIRGPEGSEIHSAAIFKGTHWETEDESGLWIDEDDLQTLVYRPFMNHGESDEVNK